MVDVMTAAAGRAEPGVLARVGGVPVVHLLGGPYVAQGPAVREVSDCAGRVLAYVSLHGGRTPRRRVAALLWPDVPEDRAAGNLRSVLWRLRAAGVEALTADKATVRLCPGVGTDVEHIHRLAERLSAGRPAAEDLTVSWWHPEVVDLLPGWDEEWIVVERERLRQHALHALEILSARLTAVGRFGEAIEAALLAVDVEPLRETARRRLVEAHLAEGNVVEARREVLTFGSLLRRELGLAPSRGLLHLVPSGTR